MKIKITLILLSITFKIVIAQSFDSNNNRINIIDLAGKKQGKWIITNSMLEKPKPCFTNDQKVEEGKFVDSKKVGVWKEYYCNNILKSKITYENNHPNGYAIMYHDNGKIKEEGLRMHDRWVGDYKLYFSNGQVQQAFNFVATGKREGPQQYYYENGRLMIDGTWVKGEKNGLLTEYYENGDLKSQKTFNGGHLDTTSIKAYKPKTPLKETPAEIMTEVTTLPVMVQKNEKSNLAKPFTGEGYWKLYNSNNKISKDGIFSKSHLVDGKIYFYNAVGILTRIAIYKEGRYIGDSPIE